MNSEDKQAWPDLAGRALGGSVIYANDELFAERENLIKPEAPAFSSYTFGHKGQIMDGWETRRRREPGHDWAIVRLGVPGIVREVVVDTSYFTGNYPPEVSVEACGAEGYPSPAELAEASWTTLVPRSAVAGDARNEFEVEPGRRATHVRLTMFPDGGVARLRVYGEPVPDPRLLPATIDLAALENGAVVTGCSLVRGRISTSPAVTRAHPGAFPTKQLVSSSTMATTPGPARAISTQSLPSSRRRAVSHPSPMTRASPGLIRLVGDE